MSDLVGNPEDRFSQNEALFKIEWLCDKSNECFVSREESNELYHENTCLWGCSGNKGADQLRRYCAADLRLCLRICEKLVFS